MQVKYMTNTLWAIKFNRSSMSLSRATLKQPYYLALLPFTNK